jgi:hypothetical protein
MIVGKFKKILKFFYWWFGCSILYAMFSVCPFCGRPGCPVGAGAAGLFGGFLTLFLQNWRNFLKRKILKRKSRQ